jgi:hypothetical protein
MHFKMVAIAVLPDRVSCFHSLRLDTGLYG